MVGMQCTAGLAYASVIASGCLKHLSCPATLLMQMFAGLHHTATGPHKLPEWPPAGSIGSIGMGMSMGMSPGHMMFGTPPLGRSVDMVDMCTQLMEAGGGRRCQHEH